MKLDYAVELSEYESDESNQENRYGFFYLYSDSKNPRKAYDSEYVILSATLHFRVNPDYNIE